MISLLFLQLILEVIKNGSKTCRVFQFVFSFCVSRLTQGVVHWWQHSPDPVARGATRSHPYLATHLRSAGDSFPLMLGAAWSWAQTSWGGSHPIFPPTHQLGSSCSPCSQLGQGNDSCTVSPLASDAVRQVRQTFCLIHSAQLRRAGRVCSNAGF